MRKIFCQKLAKEAEGLEFQPIPGVLGQRIFEQISKEAWKDWLAHQTMLINEYRLNLTQPSARDYLKTEMEKFFFLGGSEKPAEYREKP